MKHQLNMIAWALFVLLAWTGSFSTIAQAQVARTNEVVSLRDGLKGMLQNEGAANLKKLAVNVDADKAAELLTDFHVEAAGSYTVYQGIDADGNTIGSVLIVNEEGKEGPMQVLVALRNDGTVYDIGFTVFGEDKGKPAQSWGFLRQFIGKSPADPVMLGNDIDGISGATWSSESVSNAVKRAIVLYSEFFL